MSAGVLEPKPKYYPTVQFLGDRGVGKTSLISRLNNGNMPSEEDLMSSSTFRPEFLGKDIWIGEASRRIMVQIRLYDSHFSLYASPPSLSKKDIIVIVYSLSNQESFRNLRVYLQEFETVYAPYSGSRPPGLIVCANKSDVSDARLDDAFKMLREENKGFECIRTSALDRTGLQELNACIEKLISACYIEVRQKDGDYESSIRLDGLQSSRPRPDSKCC